MRKPSVLFVNRVYPQDRGATGRMLRDLAAAMVRDGWDVTVLATGARTATEQDEGVAVHRVRSRFRRKTPLAYGLTWIRLLAAAWRMPRHDLVVSMTDPPMLILAAGLVAARRKSKHIHWCQDLYPELLPVLGYGIPESGVEFLARLTRQAMKKCDRVIVIGRCMARLLVHRGLDSRVLSVIPNWPDAELSGEQAEETAAPARPRTVVRPMNVRPPSALFRDAHDMKFRVLYAGTLGQAHPVDTVLDAAQILQKTHGDIEFVFVGNGPAFERLARERGRRGLENIRLMPWQPADRLRQLMESGDVHLVTMRHEAAGMLVPCKIYSALAAHRPCILVGPEHSEAGRILLDFNAGAVVPQGEAEALADTVRRFREDGDVWFSAQEGARRAGEVFLASESIRAWIERARSVLGPELSQPLRFRKPEERRPAEAEQPREDRAA